MFSLDIEVVNKCGFLEVQMQTLDKVFDMLVVSNH